MQHDTSRLQTIGSVLHMRRRRGKFDYTGGNTRNASSTVGTNSLEKLLVV